MNDTAASPTIEAPTNDGWEWCFLEIMSHRSHWGRSREEERFGAKMLRVDVPRIEKKFNAEGGDPQTIITWSTHYYGGPAIFSFTPTDEATVMKRNAPYEPAHRLTYSPHDDDVDDDSEF